MIFLLPFSWRVRIYQWRADRDQRRRINLRAKYPLQWTGKQSTYWRLAT